MGQCISKAFPDFLQRVGLRHFNRHEDKKVGNDFEPDTISIPVPEFKPLNAFTELHDGQVPRRPMQFLFRQSGKVLDLVIQDGPEGSSRLLCQDGGLEDIILPQHNVINCGSLIGVPFITPEELLLEEDEKDAAWLCGKYSSFLPKMWASKRLKVTTRELRKFLSDSSSSSRPLPDINYAELEMMSKIHHPNVLLLLGVSAPTHVYSALTLIYERVTYGSLFSVLHLRCKRLSSRFVVTTIMQCCSALDFLHMSGFLHCAVTSHAILLVSNGCSKLGCLEYCCSRRCENSSATTSKPIIGNWLKDDNHLEVIGNWIAPEALASEDFSTRSDVYSMCSVIWELCYGQVPRPDKSLHDLRTLIQDSKLKRLPLEPEVIPAYWKPMLDIGLKIDPMGRDLELEEIIDMMRLVRNDKPPLNISLQSHSNNSSLLKSAPASNICKEQGPVVSFRKYGESNNNMNDSGDPGSQKFVMYTKSTAV